MKRHSTLMWLTISMMFGVGLTIAKADIGLSITLDRSAHFTATDGSDVQLPATSYRIEQAGESSLRLVQGTAPPIEIQATKISHDESVTSPTAVAVMEEGQDDTVHLLLVLPGGQALDAAGSYGDVKTRGFSQQTMLKAGQVAAALNQVKPAPQQTSPPPPIGVVRVPAATVGTVKPTTSVKSGAGKWISWTYLQVNHPDVVAQALAEVQAGKRPPSSVAGLATSAELNEMLKTNWAAEVTRLNSAQHAAVTTRGLSPAVTTPPSAAASVQQNAQPPSPLRLDKSLVPLPPLPLVDLGAAYSGEHNARTVTVTARADGYLEAELDIKDVLDRRFRIDQAVAYTGEFVNGAAQVYRVARGGDWNDIRPRGADPTVRVSMAGYVVLDVKAGQRVDITVAFEPHASIGPTVGKYDVPLQLSWHRPDTTLVAYRTVPLRAYCNGISFRLIAYAKEAHATTLTMRDVNFFVVATNSQSTPLNVTLSAQQLPRGVLWRGPTSVSIPPNSTQEVRLLFSVYGDAEDSPNQPITVAFNYEGKSRAIDLALSIYHHMIYWCSGIGGFISCASSSSPVGGMERGSLQTSDSDVGVDEVVVCIMQSGTWFWKINTHDWNKLELTPSDFNVTLRFNNNGPRDDIPVHISGYVDFQPYERWHDFDHWMEKNYLFAAENGVTVNISE